MLFGGHQKDMEYLDDCGSGRTVEIGHLREDLLCKKILAQEQVRQSSVGGVVVVAAAAAALGMKKFGIDALILQGEQQKNMAATTIFFHPQHHLGQAASGQTNQENPLPVPIQQQMNLEGFITDISFTFIFHTSKLRKIAYFFRLL